MQIRTLRSQLMATSLWGALAVVTLVAVTLASWALAPRAPAAPTIDSIEQRWGIRITQVGVTADGGLLDLRYLVIDPDRALRMFDDLATLPAIRTAGGTMIQLTSRVKHHQNIEAGRTYYILYKNPRDAVRPGSVVTVLVGDARLDGVVAR